ncbi:hypothetical protein VTJ49DRAFT_2200 [Mycothermus thermophilus]|uniref:SET domain-containing protein n=1 Tax=Humicola insolens TaxID=85995 RepID=A0ABR3VAS4_HUMIN
MSIHLSRIQRALGLAALLLSPHAALAHDISDNYAGTPILTPPTLQLADLDVACPLPLDDHPSAWPSLGSPWTHPPVCESSADGTTKYCVYTNSRHGPRGWSIVTTPETAANSVWILNQALNGTTTKTRLPEPPAYKMVDVPGKGKGLVTTRKIRRYEEILVDHATLMVDIMFTTRVPAFLGYRLLHAAVNQLADAESVLALGQSNTLARDKIENILRTNAFNAKLGGAPHIALYPLVSRINHACKANAYTRFMPETLQVSIRAARDIAAGEEITISYIPVGAPTSERAKKLSTWGFSCQCSLCQAPAEEREASDKRLGEIQQLRDYAIRAFQAGRAYQALRFTRQVVNLLAPEELWPLYAEQYENMARIFYTLRDRANAEKYANMALELLAEQGHVPRADKREVERMFAKFEEEEGGRY